MNIPRFPAQDDNEPTESDDIEARRYAEEQMADANEREIDEAEATYDDWRRYTR